MIQLKMGGVSLLRKTGVSLDGISTYAHDVVGLSDDFIRDVLDGDPINYWNID